jgi:hypothetical protein
MTISRRSFLASLFGAGTFGMLPCALANTTEDLQTTELTISTEHNAPPSLKGLKIAFISDIHYGEAMSESFLRKALETIANVDPDLLLLGGDYIWIPHSPLHKSTRIIRNSKFTRGSYRFKTEGIMDDFAAITSQIRPRYGTYACLGNHDHWHGAKTCLAALKRHHITPLINESVTIYHNQNPILLGAVDDYLTGFPQLPQDLKQLTKEDPSTSPYSILLCHNPSYVIDWFERNQKLPAKLTLCGHTHGGQLRYPGLKITPFCNVSDRRFLAGSFEHEQCINFTSIGLGVVELPFRIACPPEVVVIRFV